jgi:hypothetical protein
MHIRFVEEYNPVSGYSWFYAERKTWAGWLFISGSSGTTEREARERYDRIKATGQIKVKKRVIEQAQLP